MARGNKKLEALKQRAKNATRRAREKREERLHKGSAIVGAGLVGKLEQSGYIDRLPSLGPLPRMATLGLVLTGVEMFTTGKTAVVAGGVSTGLLSVAAYQFGSGQEISGGSIQGADPLPALADGVHGYPVDLSDFAAAEEAEVGALEDEALAELELAQAELAAQDA